MAETSEYVQKIREQLLEVVETMNAAARCGVLIGFRVDNREGVFVLGDLTLQEKPRSVL